MTKIDIISGFLGAGKTTLIKKLLSEAFPGEKLVLIENEFGEISIDGGFLKESGVQISEMSSGCICCSLVGDFNKALKDVAAQFHPDRILIEPSGVGKLSDVMKAVRDVAVHLDVELNSSVTVVDVKKCKMYMKNFGEFFNNQIEYAGNIVLSRTDIADKDKVEAAVAMIREHNAEATIITTPISQLTGEQLLEIIEKPDTMMADLLAQVQAEYQEHDHHHHDHHDHDHHHDHHEGHEHHHEEHDHHHEEHDHHHEDDCVCHDHGHDHHEAHAHHHEDGCDCGCHDHDHHHHHADEIFTSWGLETTIPCTREKLEVILEKLAETTAYGEVLRAKGMLPSEEPGKWLYFDLVPEQYEIREGSPDFTGRVCVIGARLKEDELNQVFGRR